MLCTMCNLNSVSISFFIFAWSDGTCEIGFHKNIKHTRTICLMHLHVLIFLVCNRALILCLLLIKLTLINDYRLCIMGLSIFALLPLFRWVTLRTSTWKDWTKLEEYKSFKLPLPPASPRYVTQILTGYFTSVWYPLSFHLAVSSKCLNYFVKWNLFPLRVSLNNYYK